MLTDLWKEHVGLNGPAGVMGWWGIGRWSECRRRAAGSSCNPLLGYWRWHSGPWHRSERRWLASSDRGLLFAARMSRSTFLLVLKGIFLTRSWSTKWAGKHSDAASTSAAGASQVSRSILMRPGYSSPSRVLNSLENTSLVAISRVILRTAASPNADIIIIIIIIYFRQYNIHTS